MNDKHKNNHLKNLKQKKQQQIFQLDKHIAYTPGKSSHSIFSAFISTTLV